MRPNVLHRFKVSVKNKVVRTGGGERIFHQHQLLWHSSEKWNVLKKEILKSAKLNTAIVFDGLSSLTCAEVFNSGQCYCPLQ